LTRNLTTGGMILWESVYEIAGRARNDEVNQVRCKMGIRQHE